MPMGDGDVKGLLSSAGKALARLPESAYLAALAELDAVGSAREFASALASLDLGIADPARDALARAVATDAWEDHRGRLLRSADQSRIERMTPSS